MFAASLRERREERRREKQRQEVLKKHLSKQPKDGPGHQGARDRRSSSRPCREGHRAGDREAQDAAANRSKPSKTAAMVSAAAAALKVAASKPTPPPPIKRPPPTPVDAVAAAVRAREGAGRAQEGRVHAAAARAARRAAGGAEDRRARADGRRAAARGEVPRVLRRRHRRPDPSRPGRHDLRVQAGRRREIQQDHRPGRRPLPRDAGRVGPDRSHPRQIDGRHPDSEPEPRADFAARAARVGRLQALARRS